MLTEVAEMKFYQIQDKCNWICVNINGTETVSLKILILHRLKLYSMSISELSIPDNEPVEGLYDCIRQEHENITYHAIKLHSSNTEYEHLQFIVVSTKHRGLVADWKWQSFLVEQNDTGSVVQRIANWDDDEYIIGVMVIDQNGKMISRSFGVPVRSFEVRMNVKDDSGTTVNISTFRVGEHEYEYIPLDLKWFEFNDGSILTYVENSFREITFMASLKVVEPYLSEKLIDSIIRSAQHQTNIRILFKQITDDSSVDNIRNMLNSTSHNIEIKQIKPVSDSSNVLIQKNRISIPFHDRYFLGDTNGLMIGTSFNSLFKNSTFVLKFNFSKNIELDFDNWYSGNKIRYNKRHFHAVSIGF